MVRPADPMGSGLWGFFCLQATSHAALTVNRWNEYNADMTKDQVKEILDRVLTWPAERQADVAHVIEIMEEQDKSGLRLTDAQVAEVRRRLAERNPKSLSLAEFNERLRRRHGV
jgi:hypothetical protein